MKSKFFLPKTYNLFLGLLFLVFIAGSCKKTDSSIGNTYEMTFTANGTKVTYTLEAALVATFTDSEGQYLGVFSGFDDNTNISIDVFDNQAITEKKYSGYTAVGTALSGVIMGYQDSSGTNYSQAGSDLEVNVTSITDTAVSGTFSGTLKASGKSDMVIADGKFTLKRFN